MERKTQIVLVALSALGKEQELLGMIDGLFGRNEGGESGSRALHESERYQRCAEGAQVRGNAGRRLLASGMATSSA